MLNLFLIPTAIVTAQAQTTVVYDASAECTFTENVLDCVFTDNISGEISYTVCTMDEHGTQCIDHN